MDLRNLLKKDDLRRLKLLEYLYFHNKQASEEELKKAMNSTSYSVLLEDIRLINQQIPEMTITRSKNSYVLNHHSGFGLDSLYSHMVSHTPEMKFLELLLYETCKTQAEAADRLFLSLTSFHRLYKKLQRFLAEKNVRIEKNPLRLCGNEFFIRYLFTVYYKERRKNTYSFFQDTSLDEELNQWIVSFAKANHLEEKYIIHEQLRIASAVAIIRLQHGHCLFTEKTAEYPDIKFPEEHLFIKLSFAIDPIQTAKEIVWNYFSDNHFVSAAHFQYALKANPWVKKIHRFAELYLKELEESLQLSITPDKKQELVTLFCDDNFVYRSNGDVITILRNVRRNFVEEYQQQYPQEMRVLQSFIDSFIARHQVKITLDQRCHQLFILLTTIPDLLEKLMPPLRILILSDIAPFHGHFLKEKAQRSLYGNLTFSVIEEIFDQHQAIFEQFRQYDLIFSTFELLHSFPDLPVITIKPIPSLEDFHEYQLAINQVVKNKL